MRKFIPKLIFRLIALVGVILLLNFMELILRWLPFEVDSDGQEIIKLVLVTLIWLCAGRLINLVFELIAFDFLMAAAIGTQVPSIIRVISRFAVYSILILLVIHFVYNQNVMAYLAAIGAGGVVIGLAAQKLIADVLIGLAVNVDRPFRLGDWIAVDVPGAGSVDGEVIEIGWRTTTIRTPFETEWVIPNHKFGDVAVKNHWRPEKPIWVWVDIVLDFEIPVERVERILTNAVISVRNKPGFVPDVKPYVLLGKVVPRGVTYTAMTRYTPWAEGGTIFMGESALMAAALTHLRNAGITPALEKQDIFHAHQKKRQLSTRDEDDVAGIVFGMALFDLLTHEEVRDLIQNSKRLEYITGHTLIEQGKEGDSMFVILEGLLDAFVRGEDGTEKLVTNLGPGQFVGEMSLLTGDPRAGTVRAATTGVAYEITKPAMTNLLEKRPELLEPISRLMAERRALISRAQAGNGDQDETQGFASKLASRMRSFFSLGN
ncbi:MAG: potassium efflux system protein [Verrucomicrobiales bacterium]|jgi:potassium efflux system protein